MGLAESRAAFRDMSRFIRFKNSIRLLGIWDRFERACATMNFMTKNLHEPMGVASWNDDLSLCLA